MEEKYIVKTAKKITEIDYSEYGTLFHLSEEGFRTENVNYSVGEDWKDADTAFSITDTPARLGYTWSKAQPFFVKKMEKHSHTKEAQLPTDQAIVLCMAKQSVKPPRAEDVIPVIIEPGYVFVLHKETWHSASHGMKHDGSYYWLAQVYDNEPTIWAEVEGDSVYIKAE